MNEIFQQIDQIKILENEIKKKIDNNNNNNKIKISELENKIQEQLKIQSDFQNSNNSSLNNPGIDLEIDEFKKKKRKFNFKR